MMNTVDEQELQALEAYAFDSPDGPSLSGSRRVSIYKDSDIEVLYLIYRIIVLIILFQL